MMLPDAIFSIARHNVASFDHDCIGRQGNHVF